MVQLFIYFYFLPHPYSMSDVSSLTRDGTPLPSALEGGVLSPEPLGKSQISSFSLLIFDLPLPGFIFGSCFCFPFVLLSRLTPGRLWELLLIIYLIIQQISIEFLLVSGTIWGNWHNQLNKKDKNRQSWETVWWTLLYFLVMLSILSSIY